MAKRGELFRIRLAAYPSGSRGGEHQAVFGDHGHHAAIMAFNMRRPLAPIGILSSASLSAFTELLGAFRRGLQETGFIEGQNVAIESRWAEGRFERLPGMATELVERHAAVIVTTGGSSTLAVKAARL